MSDPRTPPSDDASRDPASRDTASRGGSPHRGGAAPHDASGATGPADRRAPIAAGLILAALALGFAAAPTLVAWADGVRPGLGFPAAIVLAILLGGGFVAVFWLRGRARRGR